MNTLKWLKRKYPVSYEELLPFTKEFDDPYRRKMHVGRLTADIYNEELYKAGTIVLFTERSPLDENYPGKIILARCVDPDLTVSGFHSFHYYGSGICKLLE